MYTYAVYSVGVAYGKCVQLRLYCECIHGYGQNCS